MSKLWFTESGKLALCSSGKIGVGNKCVCGCPSFTGRTITYVDKNVVGGIGDGSSPANAYTSIQDAIDAKPKTEIQIQGYGESDAYPAGIVLAECVYLKGVDDVWIGLNSENFGMSGLNITTTKIESINIKYNINSGSGFLNCYNLIDCHVEYISGNVILSFGFLGCNIIDSCTGNGHFQCFQNCIDLIDCNSIDSLRGGFSNCEDLIDCSSTNTGTASFWQGFVECSTLLNCSSINGPTIEECINTTLIGCIVDSSIDIGNNGGFFNCDNSIFTNCISQNNQGCGYAGNSGATFISCQDINNCLSGNPSCNPITGICDTV